MSKHRRWVYRFDQLASVERRCETWDEVKGLLGGKGANLADMTRLGLPVPPGFVVTTAACRAYLAAGALPDDVWDQALEALADLEVTTGKRFGDPANPLLVSCRSGAKFSMPGMMDTVLNIGLNDDTAAALARLTGDERFAWDAYRRLVQMFGRVVMGVADEPFEAVLRDARKRRGATNDADLPAADLREITRQFRALVRREAGREFPLDPQLQLREATEAVFRSWRGKRAQDYRRAAGIADDLGTAVNIVAMVFGNLGAGSATGVATTRNVSTGEAQLEGDYLLNAQGEDVVAGTREVMPIAELARDLPAAHAELVRIAQLLERHHRDVQDIEFTVENNKLWMLQTRDAKRTARAAVRIAVELARERRITRREALARVKPDHVDFFLHPQLDPAAVKVARAEGRLLATGLNVSPGAAVGELAFDADRAEQWAKTRRDVVMIRAETKPDDVHGMLAARGVITSRGGRTSHAALVARQFGKPAVVGILALEVDGEARTAKIKRGAATTTLREGDWISLDGTTGEVFLGKLPTIQPSVDDPFLRELLAWADEVRQLGVWTNADYPRDAMRARELGAEGIGLCRTEHMFFETERLPLVQKLILATTAAERTDMLARLLISRDDAETGFLTEYLRDGILPDNPFATLDERGVGHLMQIAVDLGRTTRPDLEIGICGEHGGDPRSIDLCHRLGLDYVSCSPFRIPVARLAAAHATLTHGKRATRRHAGHAGRARHDH